MNGANRALSTEVIVVNERGLHTRMATEIVKLARSFSSSVELAVGSNKVDAKSVMALLTLAAKKGTTVRLTVEGDDQTEAFTKLKSMIEGGFPGVVD